jgi:hypothetical protein
MTDTAAAAISYLRSPLAIRARCEAILEAGLAGKLRHFAVELGALATVVERVSSVIREFHPDGQVPIHGRVNHLRVGKVDRVAAFHAKLADQPPEQRARTWIDFIVVSVLLDAGAGDAWRYREPGTDVEVGRSEGLALASLHAFEAGTFSSDPINRLCADADGLRSLDPGRLADAFQIADDNPLVGVDARMELIHDLGTAVANAPHLFPDGRPGGLIEKLKSSGSPINAQQLLTTLLEALAPIWRGRVELGGANLGDVWRHPSAGGTGPSEGLVPIHRLPQWLAYSLIEPLELSGFPVAQPGALTGLAEYRNGGLFVDLGVLVPKHPDVCGKVHEPGDEVVVEWRALTVALLDRVAEGIQKKLGKSPTELPLARVLEGGTWAAGRAIAAELRPGGGPPIRVHSDGSLI